MAKWGALLHDICKRGLPKFDGKDHIHPFTSGAATLNILKYFKIIDGDIEEILKLINLSV